MAAGNRNRVDGFRAQVVGYFAQFTNIEAFEVFWGFDFVESGRERRHLFLFFFVQTERCSSILFWTVRLMHDDV